MLSVSALKSRGLYFTNDIRRIEYPCRGAYVTEKSGDINWTLFAHEPIDFVYIRASEGKAFEDKRYAYNVSGALQQGISLGLVHEFDYGVSGLSQAKRFSEKLRSGMLLPALDIRKGLLERILYDDDKEAAEEINAFVGYLRDNVGCGVLLMCDEDTYKRLGISSSGALVWAQAGSTDNYAESWTLLSYSDSGRSKALANKSFTLLTAGYGISKEQLFRDLTIWINNDSPQFSVG